MFARNRLYWKGSVRWEVWKPSLAIQGTFGHYKVGAFVKISFHLFLFCKTILLQLVLEKHCLECRFYLWQSHFCLFQVNLTQEARFNEAVRSVCSDEVAMNRNLSQCLEIQQPGYSLSCVIDHFHEIKNKNTKCYKFLCKWFSPLKI